MGGLAWRPGGVERSVQSEAEGERGQQSETLRELGARQHPELEMMSSEAR